MSYEPCRTPSHATDEMPRLAHNMNDAGTPTVLLPARIKSRFEVDRDQLQTTITSRQEELAWSFLPIAG